MEPTRSHSNGSVSALSDMRRVAAAVEALNNLIFLASRKAGNPETFAVIWR
jgi:hypothetical protein